MMANHSTQKEPPGEARGANGITEVLTCAVRKGPARPPNAGRKKGTPNKATVERRRLEAEALEALSKEMPLDYMLRIMRDPDLDPARRDVMARSAAPMCHPQLQAIAHKSASLPQQGAGELPGLSRILDRPGGRPFDWASKVTQRALSDPGSHEAAWLP